MSLDPHELPHLIVGACMEVHRHLGPGLAVEVYRDCLGAELRMKEIIFQRDPPLPYTYKGQKIESSMRVDFLVEKSVLVAVEAVDNLEPCHKNRLKNILRLTGYEVGLLVNFNVDNLRDGVKRIIVAENPPALHYRQDPVSTPAENRPLTRSA